MRKLLSLCLLATPEPEEKNPLAPTSGDEFATETLSRKTAKRVFGDYTKVKKMFSEGESKSLRHPITLFSLANLSANFVADVITFTLVEPKLFGNEERISKFQSKDIGIIMLGTVIFILSTGRHLMHHVNNNSFLRRLFSTDPFSGALFIASLIAFPFTLDSYLSTIKLVKKGDAKFSDDFQDGMMSSLFILLASLLSTLFSLGVAYVPRKIHSLFYRGEVDLREDDRLVVPGAPTIRYDGGKI